MSLSAGSPFLDPDDPRFKGPVARPRPRPPPLPGIEEPARRRKVLGVGRTVALTIAIWMRLFFPLTAISLLVYSPMLVLGYLHDVDPRGGLLGFLFGNAYVRFSLDWLVPYQLASAMIGYRVVRHLEGRKTGMLRSVLEGLRRSPHVLLAGLLSGVGTLLGFWVVVFPGFVLYTTWYVSIPAAVVERKQKPGSAALYRSAELTEGERWTILGVGVTLHVVRFVVWAVLVYAALQLLLELVSFRYTIGLEALVTSGISGISALLVPPLAVAPAAVYHLLRTKREGLDPHRLSEIFG